MEVCKASVMYRKKLVNIPSANVLDISDKVHFPTRKEAEDWIENLKTLDQNILFDFRVIENKEVV